MVRDSNGSAYLSVREAARRLGVHENTVRNWVAAGILRSARPPGTRFHRFDPSEVERVRVARGAGPESVQHERRIIGPELADATRLGTWADTAEARTIFPRLVRRLVATAPGVTALDGRAGEGVAIDGWDLRATLAEGTPWLPAGCLAFELGVGAAPRSKAQSDYDKRTAEPLDVDPSDTVFVFATPRRWPGGAAWAAERAAEGRWRSVRVLDGDAFEAWLDNTPAVHYWISEQMGLQPHGVRSAERWWTEFSSRTRPALPAELLLAGRDSQRNALLEGLTNDGSVIGVRARWKDEALAFTCVALRADTDDAPGRPTLLVSSAEVWARIVAEPGLVTLVPLFPNPDLTAVAARDKRVVVALDADEAQHGNTIQLPPPDRRLAAESLRAVGLEFETADRLAALARRSMPALVRSLSVNPNFAKPAWARPPHGEVFAPLLLVGSWVDSADDNAVISELVDRPWSEIERTLRAAADTNDPPFVLSGSTWRAASREELFDVLSGLLTSGDVRRWASLVSRVLLEQDPLADLSAAERLQSSVGGSHQTRASRTLRQGLAEGLALLGSHGDDRVGGTNCALLARNVVVEVLGHADDDLSGRTWRSLTGELSLIAEAAPTAFLERVLEGSRGSRPLLLTMFSDASTTSFLDSSSAHTGLLWALETLCWSPDHLLDASLALAQLADIDPGGRLGNRPGASLAAVLVPWARQTSASLDRRIEAIDLIVREFPDVGWKLLARLWPSHHGTTSPPSSPRYRDWLPDSRGVPISEWLAVISHVVGCSLREAGHDAGRWAELIDRLGPLPPDQRDRAIASLDAVIEAVARDPADQLLLWETLRKEIERHRTFATADWAIGEQPITHLERIADRIEPRDSVERHARLFDWRPDIGPVKLESHGDYEAALSLLRAQAVRETLDTDSIEGIGRLAERAPVPGQLGWTVAAVAGDDHRDTLMSWLTRQDKKGEVALAWARQRAHTDGIQWVVRAVKELDEDDARLALMLQVSPTPEAWRIVADASGALAERYWGSLSPWGIASEDVGTAATEFLARDRPWAAVTAIAAEMHRPNRTSATDPQLITAVLDAAASSAAEPATRGDSLGYEIGQLLDSLEAAGVDNEVVARHEFTFFQALEHQRQPRALYAALGDHPELFVDLVSKVYRAKKAPRKTPDQHEAAYAAHAWHVLENWRTVPGLRDDQTIDSTHLDRWVEQARLLLSDQDRGDVGDEQIGHLLSGSPVGSDGAWPAEPIRDLVERLGNRELESGLHIGKLNARGITSRAVYAGGEQERALADQFREWSNVTAGRWRRTSRLLRELAESYERDAVRWDIHAQEDADAG